jgi:hypothetical protein
MLELAAETVARKATELAAYQLPDCHSLGAYGDRKANKALVHHYISISLSQWSSAGLKRLLHSLGKRRHGYTIYYSARLREDGFTVLANSELPEVDLFKAWVTDFARATEELTVLAIDCVGVFNISMGGSSELETPEDRTGERKGRKQ